LLTIMRRLRTPGEGCPWDLEQSFDTIAPYTIEEAYEVADAIERRAYDELREELGDLLLQVVFHAQMADEDSLFDFDAVIASICDKLVRRHPHVFGDATVASAKAQSRAWEQAKAEERDVAVSTMDGVPRNLPALARAQKVSRRAAAVGFDWPDLHGVIEKVREELDELEGTLGAGEPRRVREEIGDLLFAVTSLARHAGVDAEHALSLGNRKFERRFRYVEDRARAAGVALPEAGLGVLEGWWEEAKKAGN
jgi:MazG family protein